MYRRNQALSAERSHRPANALHMSYFVPARYRVLCLCLMAARSRVPTRVVVPPRNPLYQVGLTRNTFCPGLLASTGSRPLRWRVTISDDCLQRFPAVIIVPDVTRILSDIEQGDPNSAEKLLPLVYDELRKLAAAKMARENPGQTLQATALVHDAYIRPVDIEQAQH